jgi:hypothetical protein
VTTSASGSTITTGLLQTIFGFRIVASLVVATYHFAITPGSLYANCFDHRMLIRVRP